MSANLTFFLLYDIFRTSIKLNLVGVVMLQDKKEENYQFRILYFVAIIMVVAGHCGMGGFSLFYEWFHPFTFELPLFMFASGYFFTKNQSRRPVDIVISRVKKLMVPLYVWNLFYGILVVFLKHIGVIQYGGSFNFTNLFLSPLYSGHSFLFNLGSWFLVPLFMVQVFSVLFLPLLKKRKGAYFIFLIYLLLGMFGVYLAIEGYNTKWWLVLTRFLYFLPFFGLGILYKEKLEKKDTIKNIIYFSIIMLLQLGFIYYRGGMPRYTPSWCLGFDNLFFPFIFGFLGIFFWLRISKILVPSLKSSKIVSLVSKNTFSIMMHHMFGFFILNLGWYFLTQNFSFIKGFDVTKFSSDIWYIYLPSNLVQFRTLYLFFGIVFSLIVSFMLKNIKSYLLKWLENYKNKKHVNKKMLTVI